ncbi:Membrane bound L-sorbosone dehydrogenase [Serratia rubidaea]|uniref:Membrane bound L-sorbosone dehydrogenase n=1 Tax=Serratia rubidaea TaxID=61652 RepID=A0A447QUR0_SERRU|nr:Membrane bound L-sorbosone dehydrogenase [Serratia rubidaea]
MKKFNTVLTAAILSALLAGCDNGAQLDPQKQIGPDPELPQAKNFLMPPMQVPEGAAWRQGEQPKVAEGLKIEKIADGLMHPRQVYVLPNNDILVAESNAPAKPTTRPKQLIMGIVQKASGKGGAGGNRITLLRNVNGQWQKHTFIENLRSPFGIQLIGNTLWVANADSLVKFPYQEGQTEIREPGLK